jgi:hypothetical protein
MSYGAITGGTSIGALTIGSQSLGSFHISTAGDASATINYIVIN